MRRTGAFRLLGVAALSLSGCANMPTPTEELGVPFVSSEAYAGLSCEELSTERARLATLEMESLVMHEKRRDASHGHAFFYGWGRGDGLETVELVKVRGEIGAVDRAMNVLGCVD